MSIQVRDIGNFKDALRRCGNDSGLGRYVLEFEAKETDAAMNRALLEKLILDYSRLVIELEKKIGEVRLLSITDPLTGLYNRQFFNEALRHEIDRSKRYDGVFSLVMFDIDHFKAINDQHGHDAGDDVLVWVVAIVKSLLRESDIFSRWGGEEFLVIAPGTDDTQACAFAERIRNAVEKARHPRGIDVTCSFGVVNYQGETPDLLFKRLDDLLYTAKREGRNRVSC